MVAGGGEHEDIPWHHCTGGAEATTNNNEFVIVYRIPEELASGHNPFGGPVRGVNDSFFIHDDK